MNQKELNFILSQFSEKLIGVKEVLSFDEVASFTGLSKSYLYKLTSSGGIPHYKPFGKLCYFNRKEVEEWLQQNRVSTKIEIENRASTYVSLKQRRGG